MVIGVSDYRDEPLDLIYADKDAADIARALEITAQPFFGKENVHIDLLTTSVDKQPNKTTILQTFAAVAQKAKPEDVFVVYLAGHGVNYGSPNSQFYYLTKDMAQWNMSDPAIRKNYMISTNEWTEWLKAIPAQKQIMILDACSSGSLVNDVLTQSRNLSSSQRRALERMKDRTGMFILAGSAADQVSYEASQFGQGLLTYSLLLGMSGSALRENQYVDVMQLFQFAADKVPEFATYVGGVQRPVVAAPLGSNSFDIGQVTQKTNIPLSAVKPIFIRSNFQEKNRFDDVLDLADKLDARFTEVSGQGKAASIIFVDVKKYPNAYAIKGQYVLKNTNIKLEGKIFKNREIIHDFEVEGDSREMEGILNKILTIIEQNVK